MKIKLTAVLKIAIVACLTALVALVYFRQGDFTSLDLGRHLKNGAEIWHHADVLYGNFYSFTEPAFPFINHHWLSGAIYYGLYLAGGFSILTWLNFLLGAAAVFTAFFLAVRRSDFFLAAVLALPVILLLSERVDVRPEMFSYLFLLLSYYLTENFRANGFSRKLIWLAPAIAVWSNLHIYFFLGLFLISLTALEQLIIKRGDFFKDDSSRRYFYLTLASWAAALLNPNFFRGLAYPFNILKQYGYEIVENKSPFYLENLTINHNIWLFKALLVLLIAGFVAGALAKRKIKLYDAALAAVFSGLAILYIRNLPIFGLMVWPLTAGNIFDAFGAKISIWQDKSKLFWRIAAGLAVAAVLIWAAVDSFGAQKFFSKRPGAGQNRLSLESIDFYRQNNLRGPIFNNYDFGGALIFWLYPEEKVFTDNRPEAYSLDFFKKIYIPMMQNRADWEKFSRQYKINLIYLSHTDGTPWARQFMADRLKHDGWPLIYFDDYTAIMIKAEPANQGLIDKYKITGQNFADRLNQLSARSDRREKIQLANLAEIYGRADLAEALYMGILSVQPDRAEVLAALGLLYAGQNSAAGILKSISYLNQALSKGYRLPAIFNQLGLNYWNLADYAEAKNMWRRSLSLDGSNEHANYYLSQAEGLIK